MHTHNSRRLKQQCTYFDYVSMHVIDLNFLIQIFGNALGLCAFLFCLISFKFTRTQEGSIGAAYQSWIGSQY